jgi:hypothetical protein
MRAAAAVLPRASRQPSRARTGPEAERGRERAMRHAKLMKLFFTSV